MAQRRQSARTRPLIGPSPATRRRWSRLNRGQLAFSLLAVLMICSLVVGLVGTIAFDELTGSRSDDTITLDEADDEFEEQLRRAVAARPDDASAASQLAGYLANTGRLTEAIPYFEKALALDPDDWETRLIFARSLAEGGKRPDAELQFRRVLEAQPENAQAHYYLAELYRYWVPPRTDQAIAEYRATIAVGPDTYVAELSRQALIDLGAATPIAAAASPEAAP